MSVIEPSCARPSENSPGCGCAASRTTDKTTGKAAAAAVTALAAATCTACCILPFTLPAVMLAAAGGSIAVLDHAHGWVTTLAIGVAVCAWLWIGWQVRRARRPAARPTMAFMILATFLTVSAASWPLLEPVAFKTLGIVKKKATSHQD
jgi:cytochrome bd-type quinol oxidase subunit 2